MYIHTYTHTVCGVENTECLSSAHYRAAGSGCRTRGRFISVLRGYRWNTLRKKKKKIVNIFVVYTGSVYKEHNAVGYETKKGFCVIFGPPESHATVNPSRRDRVRFEGVCARGRRNNSFSRPAGSGSLPRTYTRSGARAATGSSASSPHCALAPPGGRTCPPHPYGRVHDECNTGKKMTPGRR